MKSSTFFAVFLILACPTIKCNFDDMLRGLIRQNTPKMPSAAELEKLTPQKRIFKKIFYGSRVDEDLIVARYTHACQHYLKPVNTEDKSKTQVDSKRKAICSEVMNGTGNILRNRHLANRMVAIVIETMMELKFHVDGSSQVQARKIKKILEKKIKKLREKCSDPDNSVCSPTDEVSNTPKYQDYYHHMYKIGGEKLKNTLRAHGLKLLI